MIAQLRMLVGQVQRSGFQVSTSTTQLSATAKEQELIVKHQMESMQTTGPINQGDYRRLARIIGNHATGRLNVIRNRTICQERTNRFESNGRRDAPHERSFTVDLRSVENDL